MKSLTVTLDLTLDEAARMKSLFDSGKLTHLASLQILAMELEPSEPEPNEPDEPEPNEPNEPEPSEPEPKT